MDLGLADRVFVLTGASKGLGFATAQALVADGARVVVSSRDQAQVDAAVAALGGAAHAAGVAADLADPATPTRLVEAATGRFGRFDGALISVGGPARVRRPARPTTSGASPSRRSSWVRCAPPGTSPAR